MQGTDYIQTKHKNLHPPLKVLDLKIIKASGSSIREAEKNAAKLALELLHDK